MIKELLKQGLLENEKLASQGPRLGDDSGWCSDRSSNPGAWGQAEVRFRLRVQGSQWARPTSQPLGSDACKVVDNVLLRMLRLASQY